MSNNSNETISASGTVRLSDAIWAKARCRAEVIEEIAKYDNLSRATAAEAAKKLNLSERTIYSLLKRWRESGHSITSLVSEGSNGGRGRSRLDSKLESLISDAITDTYLSRQRPSVASLMRTIKELCHKAGLILPSRNSVLARIKILQHDKVLFAREGPEAVRKLKPVEGSFPKTDNPMDVIQIDHTPVDLIIVDTYNRQPIGRPWITIAIDIYSRSIVGFCLTLEPPSATSVGLCLAQTVVDKRPYLERIGVQLEWPMSGKPKAIHVDNGSEFHSEALRRGCEVHGIQVRYRPIGSPHYGGIVERVIGTMMKMVHDLPGTTFSNIAEQGEYDSEKRSALTLEELEKWFVLAIASYHSSMHSGIGESPIAKWKLALDSGWEPYYIQNPKTFLVDFLPIVYRNIQRQGFVIDHITYISSSLKPLITNRKAGYKFTIRRDPRDLSRIYVLHPEENHYLEIPYRAIGNPAITLWEHRLAVKRIREEGRKTIDEEEIIKIIGKMRVVTEDAVSKSKSARRKSARLKHLKDTKEVDKVSMSPESGATDLNKAVKPAKPFDDIEEW